MNARALISFSVLFSTLAAGCADEGPTRENSENYSRVDCQKVGTAHSGTIASAVWLARESPHQVRDTVLVTGTLSIEPGALVCGAPSAQLRIRGQLVAHGTRDDPIIFTAVNAEQPWAGIGSDSGNIHLTNATVEYARTAVGGGKCDEIVIDSILVRRSNAGVAGITSCPMTVSRSVFDTITGAAISSEPTHDSFSPRFEKSLLNVTVQDNLIRNAGIGIELRGWNGAVNVSGGRIEDSGSGIFIDNTNIWHHANIDVASAKPVRVVGSGSSFKGTVVAFTTIWPHVQDRDSLRGNVSDTVVLSGAYAGELLVTRDNPIVHVLSGGQAIDAWTGPIARIRMEAGSSLRFEDFAEIGALIVNANAAEPAGFSAAHAALIGCAAGPGLGLRCDRLSNDTSYLRHMTVVGGCGGFFAGHSLAPVIVESVDFRAAESCYGDFGFSGEGSSIANSTFTGGSRLSLSEVRAHRIIVRGMTNGGIAIAGSNVKLSECTVSQNTGSGIVVFEGTGIEIRDCNIEDNTEFGVKNWTAGRVDARRNWWGDPAGPLGPNGDGVDGDVDYSDFLTSPHQTLSPPIS